ncbi:MAG: ABC transporter ATP-binding protein [Oscillospiraceae bacterium]|nr:ABC transporter ATP-binding protein [Oscillospiraceae bacterium]
MKLLEAQGLRVRFGALEALRGLDFAVEEGRWLMLVGPNGAGKSTVVNAISQGLRYEGALRWRGRDLRRMAPGERARHIGVLAQRHAVGYAFTVEEVVRLGRYARAPGLFSREKADADGTEAVELALEQTGLQALRRQSVLTLSGGELQRVFLAQLFAQDPELLILDEPGNHLDMVYQKQTFQLLRDWLRRPGRAVLTVVHDLSLALAYGDEALLLDHGAAAAYGPVREALRPATLERVYGMDVAGWMRELLAAWGEDAGERA